MKLRKPWQQRAVGRVGNVFLRGLGATWRIRNRITYPPAPGVYVFLHGNILMSAYVHRDIGVPILISTHRDGELIAQVARRLGFDPVRGSSTRGGAGAVRELLKKRDHGAVAVTPDGPRGPRASVKPGLVQLAGLLGWPIRTMGFAASRARRLSSWDRFAIPKPFARVACVPGEAIEVPSGADAATCEALAARVSTALLAADELAEKELAAW
ncbi:MAG: lysophospholipid acyltransferase family protein [Planctomycetes bacterium]|nr:lysophospholipid acyltransferase family protein [Planctomycetota bacterium]